MFKVVITALFLISNVYAGDRAGNGGDVLICKSKGRPSIQFFDIYEAHTKGFELDTSAEYLGEGVNKALDRLVQLDPHNGPSIMKGIEPFLNDIQQYENGEARYLQVTQFSDDLLIDIQDTIETTMPEGCEIQQLIIHNKNPFWRTKPFTISKRLWDRLSLHDKTMAVIHEALYVFYSSKGWEDSRFVRHLNAVLNSSFYTIYGMGTYLQDIDINVPKNSSFHFSVLGPDKKASLPIKKDGDRFYRESCTVWENILLIPYYLHLYCMTPEPTLMKFNDQWLIVVSVITRQQEILGYQAFLTEARPEYYPYSTSPSAQIKWIEDRVERMLKNDPKYPKVFITKEGKIIPSEELDLIHGFGKF